MKTTQKLTFLFLLATLIFAGCDKNEIETKKNTNPLQPNANELQAAINKLPAIAEWNSLEKPNVDFKTPKAGEVLQISGYYSDGGTYFISGILYVQGCVPADQKIYVVTWLYDYAIGQWKNVSLKTGVCMAEDNLDSFVSYYSNNAMTDFYVIAAAQIYIENETGGVSLWNTFYSNVIFLNGPY